MLGSEHVNDLESVKNLSIKATDFINRRVREFPEGFRGQKILHDLKIPFLQMDLPEFDWETMLSEGLSLHEQAVAHRSDNSRGWKSLCLHGLDAHKTMSCDRYGYVSEREAPYQWTWAADKAPVTAAYLKSLFEKGYFSELYRVRFMFLEPGGYINFHRDREEGRTSLGPLNIALNMPEKCHWIFEKWGFVPFVPGSGFAVDVSNMHGVWNQSNEMRVHIIIHGRYGPEYYNSLERSLNKKRVALEPADKEPKGNVSREMDQPNHKLGAILWKQNFEIKNPKLFSTCENITEHFLKLKANRSVQLESGHSLTAQMEKLLKLGCGWAFVVTPGLILKDGLFRELHKVVRDADPDTFMYAHILDRKDRWYGIHGQCFLVNLKAWDRLGRPPCTRFVGEAVDLSSVERSPENIHDDYTPIYLKKGSGGDSLFRPKILGWNWIDLAMKANLKIENFNEAVRGKKMFLYPEQNETNLLSRLEDPLLSPEELRSRYPLTDHQQEVYDFLDMEYRGLDRKLFVFNTEQVRPTYQQSYLKPIDVYFGLPAGFMDLHMLHRHKFRDGAELVYFDVNQTMFEIKKAMLNDWDGRDYPGFLKKFMEKNGHLFKGQLMTVNDEQASKKWEEELKIWKSPEEFVKNLNQVKALPVRFVHVNLVEDQEPIFEVLSGYRNKSIGFWYSNCFNYTPGLAQSGWELEKLTEKGVELLNGLYHLAVKNNLEITVYGEEIERGTAGKKFGQNIFDMFN